MTKPSLGSEGLLNHALTVVSIFGLIIYSIVRVGMDSFYGALDVKPEEVGLTYITTIVRAAIAIPLVLVLVGFLAIPFAMFSGVTMLLLLEDEGRAALSLSRRLFPPPPDQAIAGSISRLEAGQIVNPVGFVCGVALLLSVMTLASSAWDLPDPFLGAFILSILIGIGYCIQAMRPVKAQAPKEQSWKRKADRTFNYIALIVVIMISYVVIIGAVQEEGQDAARIVIQGAIPSRQIGLLAPYSFREILNASPDCVTLVSASANQSSTTTSILSPRESDKEIGSRNSVQWTPPTKMMYLGQANNTLVLYMIGEGDKPSGPVRIPASTFTILPAELDDEDKCRY